VRLMRGATIVWCVADSEIWREAGCFRKRGKSSPSPQKHEELGSPQLLVSCTGAKGCPTECLSIS
jgi:hypothetical protein